MTSIRMRARSLGINSAVDATGAAFENLELGGAAKVDVTDTLDEVVAKLTATRRSPKAARSPTPSR